jgi:nitroreductase
LVIREEDGLSRIRECTPCHFEAPVVLCVCSDNNVARPKRESTYNWGAVDASIAMTQMMLVAHELGLGTCWVGRYEVEKIRERFTIPEHYDVVSLLPIGYPAADAEPREAHFTRQAMEDMVSYGDF